MTLKKTVIIFSLLISLNIWAQEFEPQYELDSSSISARINPERLISQIARNFTNKYANDYVCEILQYRTVMMNNAYYEVDAYQGIYASLDFNQLYKGDIFLNPATKSYLAPLTVMRSYPYNYDGKALKQSAQFGSDLSISYQNNPSNNLFLKKRTLEVASPLNPQLQKLFDYRIDNFFEDEDEEQYISLIFETKEDAFPLKTPLKGRGKIIYNVSQRAVVSLYVENHIDFYSVRVPAGIIYDALATNHKLDVEYELIDGKLYTSSITLHVEWTEPESEGEERSSYSFIPNSRPDPFKNRLKEYERCDFSNYIFLNKTEAARVKGLISYIDMNELYMGQFKEDRWKDIELEGVDMDNLRKDINKENLPLEYQARRYGLSGYQYFS